MAFIDFSLTGSSLAAAVKKILSSLTDSALSTSSTNPVQNKVVASALANVPTTYAASATAAGAALKTGGIPYGECDSTSTSTAFTATVDGITELSDGTCVMLKNGVVTSASGWTLNVNGLGALPVYTNMAAATRDTTLFNKVYTMLFVYDSTRVSGGCWICYRGYDSNSNYYDRMVWSNVKLTAGAASGRYSIGFVGTDGCFYGIAQTASTGTSKTLNTGVEFDGTRVFYQLTATYATGYTVASSACYSRHPTVDLRYSCNQGSWMTAHQPVYMILHPQTSGYFTLGSTVFTQTLPTTEDGLCYMPVGIAYSTYQIVFEPEPVFFYYKDSAIRIWTNAANADVDLSDYSTTSEMNTAISTAVAGIDVGVTSVNGSTGAVTVDVPTAVSELTNDAGYTTNTGTITGITMNSTSMGTSGVVNLGTVLTEHQDISSKADVSALASYTPTSGFATVNGSSITGGGDVRIVATSGTITIDASPTSGSTNAVSSGGVYNIFDGGYYY